MIIKEVNTKNSIILEKRYIVRKNGIAILNSIAYFQKNPYRQNCNYFM